MLNKTSLIMPILACLALCDKAWCQNSDTSGTPPVRVVEPDKKTDSAHAAIMDTERFELGAYTGLLSVEDFNTNPVLGLSFVYHLNTRWFAQLNYGSSSVSRATFEEVIGLDFLSSSDRDFNYTTLSASWQALHGRSYFGTGGKYNSGFYLTAGLGNVEFAGNSGSSLLVGASYRIIRTDFLSINFDYRNHIFKREFIGDDKQTFNNELAIGFNFFF